jgi:hypothetical protein
MVRALGLKAACYHRLLYVCHNSGMCIERLRACWTRLALTLFTPVRLCGRLLVLGDGLKVAKEGRKMPAVKKLHQSSADNSKVTYLCKAREQMRRRVVFFQTFYNFVRPHMSLRVEIPAQDRVSKGMIQPKWRQRTPAMAAGLTDHVWMFRELLTAKFEPIHYQSISG